MATCGEAIPCQIGALAVGARFAAFAVQTGIGICWTVRRLGA